MDNQIKPWKSGDSYFDGNSYKTRAQAFAAARKNGMGVFTYKGKQYNTMQKGENADEFRKAHADYDYFLGNVASNQGGWKPSNPIQTSYKINNVPDTYTEPLPKSPNSQTPVKTKLSMFTNNDIRNLGFRNYAGMVSAIGNQANANNNFVKAMIDRYGSDTSKWNQNTIENDLGVKGTYRSFGRGDFGDMSRAMASWIGQNNGEIDKQDLQNRTGSDGVVYSNNRVKNLFDSVQLPKKQYTFNFTPIGNESIKFKQGGQMYKYQARAQMMQPQQASSQNPIDQIAQLAQLGQLAVGYLQGDKASKQKLIEVLSNEQVAPKLLQIVDAGVKKQDKRAMIIAQAIKALQQGGTRKARLGAKLDYIKQSIGECPEGQEIVYFKKGGEICKMCAGKKMQDGGKSDPIKNFKKKKVNKHQQGSWIDKDKKIWNWDSTDRFNRIKNYYQGKSTLSNDDWRYLNANPELESALHNLYKASTLPNKRTTATINYQRNTNNMPKGADPNAKIATVPDSTNNFKGNLGVGQFTMSQKSNSKTTNQTHNTKPSPKTSPKQNSHSQLINKYNANNQRKQHFNQWTAYVKKNQPNMLGKFKTTMQNRGYTYNWNTGIYSKPGSSYRLNNGQLQTQNIYTGNWSNINSIGL